MAHYSHCKGIFCVLNHRHIKLICHHDRSCRLACLLSSLLRFWYEFLVRIFSPLSRSPVTVSLSEAAKEGLTPAEWHSDVDCVCCAKDFRVVSNKKLAT